MGGGLYREGAYSRFWLRGEGIIREGGLIKRGLNRAFMALQFDHVLGRFYNHEIFSVRFTYVYNLHKKTRKVTKMFRSFSF